MIFDFGSHFEKRTGGPGRFKEIDVVAHSLDPKEPTEYLYITKVATEAGRIVIYVQKKGEIMAELKKRKEGENPLVGIGAVTVRRVSNGFFVVPVEGPCEGSSHNNVVVCETFEKLVAVLQEAFEV